MVIWPLWCFELLNVNVTHYRFLINVAGLTKVYEGIPTRVIGTWFCGRSLGGGWQPIDLHHYTVFSFVMAYNNKNVGGLFGYNFTFCVPNQHLWFSNSLYLKIYVFILCDFMWFGDKYSFSISYTEEFVFFYFTVHKKNLLRQLLRYITPGSTYGSYGNVYSKSYFLRFAVLLPS